VLFAETTDTEADTSDSKAEVCLTEDESVAEVTANKTKKGVVSARMLSRETHSSTTFDG